MSSGTGPRQVELIGPVAGPFTYFIAAALILAGPLSGLFGDSWVDGLCTGIFTFPIGIGLAFATYEWRATARRFAAAGLPGMAEIVAVNGIRVDGEDDSIAELTVRITGSGFETFEAECEVGARNPPQQPGERFTVMVDPADSTFAVGYDHLFPRD
ncbi:hypothetical protein OIE68_30015 [Nocardia vinacea]|uniref:Uncharacterized protein n=1 Tax=Nocardia vinacea TaxID=96468 RepID=A0ABZ1Z2B2_9NOCA|nr:hypothetical protein OIE68_30015 [Nocardia vinacea]